MSLGGEGLSTVFGIVSGLGLSQSPASWVDHSDVCHGVWKSSCPLSWLILSLYLSPCIPSSFSSWSSRLLKISHLFSSLASSMLVGWFQILIFQIICLFSSTILLLCHPFVSSSISFYHYCTFLFSRNYFLMFDWSLFRTTYLQLSDATTFLIILTSG